MVSDDPESFADLDGHDDLSYWAGKISAFVSDNLLGIGRVESSNSDFKAGQTDGDEAALTQSAFEITAGEVVKDSGEALTLSVVGSEAGITATGVGVFAELHGVATGSIAATHLMAERKEGQSSEPPQLSEGKKAHNEEPVRPGEKKEVNESVWQLRCLGGILVSFMVHLFVRRSCGPFGVDLFYAERFPGGLSRHMRVKFNAVVARANSAATFPSPRIRNLRIPRCSFKIPMTGSASAFRRRYNARPVVEANLLRMRRRGA